MFRAEKASSKLCRDREVEKAQELHRRKIDGVKSYLTEITRPPAPSVPAFNKSARPSTFFRRSLRQHASAPKTSHATDHKSTPARPVSPDDEYGDDFSDYNGSDDDGNGHARASAHADRDQVECKSFGKLDELRSVLVPVMAYKDQKNERSDLDYERYLDAITNPPPHVDEPPKNTRTLHQTTHSLRAGAFRMRKLKQIEADNTTIFERIKHSSSHYRTETFKRDWDQNVAYLTSICEFPVVDEVTHGAHSPRKAVHSGARKRSPFSPRPPDQLPSLQLESPPVFHPIKVFPTSPKKANPLNLSPAFRSLRKGLPQVPALPPLATSPRVAHTTKSTSATVLANARSAFLFEEATPHDVSSSPPVLPRRSSSPPRRTGSACAVAVDADDPSRYTLLKIGRFVGGKYLILTVFCGDGITNPYGFDVIALDPEVHVEFYLSITKETTHLLLETISSSTMAERTAAAAGTNLSMELIARCICDHIGYARIANSEAVFLVATVGNRGGLNADASSGDSDTYQLHQSRQVSTSDQASLLVDTPHSAMAFCCYQYVRIPSSVTTESDGVGSSYLHVYANTRPQQCCRASMRDNLAPPIHPEFHGPMSGEEYNGLVSFEVREDCEAGRSRPLTAQLQVSVRELIHRIESGRVAVESSARERLSLDRLVLLSLQYLHLERHPGVTTNEIQLVLTLSKPNNWACPAGSPCRPSSSVLPSSLDSYRHTNSRHILIESSSSDLKLSTGHSTHDELKTVLETGMLWRGAYLLARVALLSPGRLDQVTGLIVREPLDELLVINILNSSTGKVAVRILHGEQVEEFSLKLGEWQLMVGATPPLLVFAKLLLLQMRLDVDLRGQEVIFFPTLEPRYHNAGGGRSSPVALSRRGSPKKHVPTADEDPIKEVPMEMCTTQSSLKSEHQVQTQAVAAIQSLVRRFLRRRRRRQSQASLRASTTTGAATMNDVLPQEDSMSAFVLAFMRNRAAKRIQLASRNFADHARRRRARLDLDGLTITTPRSLTPIATRKNRSIGAVPAQASEDGADIAAAARDFEVQSDVSDDSDDDENDNSRDKHVDTLGVLAEDEQEESENDDTGLQQKMESIVAASALLDIEEIANGSGANLVRDKALCRREGRKTDGQFVLMRHTDRGPSDPLAEILESWIIGVLGRLDR